MHSVVRQILLIAAVGWSTLVFATDDYGFSCVQTYREWNESYFAKASRRFERANAREREDAHRIWGIYHDIQQRRYGIYATEDVRGMLGVLGVKPEKELSVLAEFVHLLESGKACSEGKPSMSWVDVLNALRPLAY